MMKILNNPIRLIANGELCSFYAPAAFYKAVLRRLYETYPKGYIDVYDFIARQTSFSGSVLLRQWKEFKSMIDAQKAQWFFDPYILKVDWSDIDDCSQKVNWLVQSLIEVINHRTPPFFEGIGLELCFEYFYNEVIQAH